MKIISMLKLKKWSLEGAKLMAVFSIDLPGRVKKKEKKALYAARAIEKIKECAELI